MAFSKKNLLKGLQIEKNGISKMTSTSFWPLKIPEGVLRAPKINIFEKKYYFLKLFLSKENQVGFYTLFSSFFVNQFFFLI